MTVRPERPSIGRLDIVLLLIVLVFLYLLIFRLPASPFYYENDQLIFLENADRMIRGEKIYRDFFQFTFPGGQVFYYFLFLIFGAKYWLVGFAAIVVGGASFWICLRVSKLLIPGPLAYLPSIFFVFFGLRWFGLDGSHRVFSPLLICLTVWVLLKGRDYPHLLLAGLFCSLATFFTQQRGLGAIVAVCVFVIVDNYATAWKLRTCLKQMAALCFAFAVSLFAMCSYFLATAGFEIFVRSTLVYPALYYRYYEQNNLGAFFTNLARSFSSEATLLEFLPALFYSFIVPLAIVAFFFVFWRERSKHEWSFWRGPMLVAIVGTFLILTTTAPTYLRLANISVPSLVLFFWIWNYFGLFKNWHKQIVVAVSVTLIGVSGIIVFRFQTRSDYIEIDGARGKVFAAPGAANERYLWLKDRTEPGDPVFEAYPSNVYFLLGLRNSARHSQFFPTEYTRPEFVAGTVEDLKRNQPKYVLWNLAYTRSAREPGDNLGALSDYVMAEYSPSGFSYDHWGQPMQIMEKNTR